MLRHVDTEGWNTLINMSDCSTGIIKNQTEKNKHGAYRHDLAS